MSRMFEYTMTKLSEESGYDYDFLVELYNEVMDNDGDWDYFVGVTMEHDW